jgi:hypothetical protein
MAACRIIDRMPDMAESLKPSVQRLLKHGSHGVVISAINLMEHVIAAQPDLAPTYGRYQISLTKILKQLSQTKGSLEFTFTIFNDPFLQMRIMRLLSLVKKESEDLDDVLATIVTSLDLKRNTGRSLLVQAVETVVATGKRPSLRGLAFSQVGKLLNSKEANVLYAALSVFSRVLYSGREIVDRAGGDSIALQRYKTLVVQCLNHRDPSIRRRALDVVSALVAENNVESLVPEVLNYVTLADAEFRIELVAKLFTAVQRFAPSVTWNFDTVHRMIIENGNAVGSDLVTTFCGLIQRHPELQAHGTQVLGESLIHFSDNQTLVQVAAWVLGEFLREDDASISNALKRIISLPQTSSVTCGYLLTAIAKLAVRFGRKADAIELFTSLKKANSLDLQQRAGEYLALFENSDLCQAALAPIESGTPEPQPAKATLVVQADEKPKDDDLLTLLAEPIQPARAELRTILTQNDKAVERIKPFPNSIEVLRRADYIMYFEVQRNPQNPKQIAVRASVFNLGNIPFPNFGMKFGVPLGWKLQARPASGNVLEPVGGRPITQQLLLFGETGVKLRMKTQVSYQFGTQPIVENGELNPIFD